MAERIKEVNLKSYTIAGRQKRGRLTVSMENGTTLPVESPSEELGPAGTGSYTLQRDRGIELARENDAPFIEVNLDLIQALVSEKDKLKRGADHFAQEEILRLNRVRKEDGDLRWAENLGMSLINGFVLFAADETRIGGEKNIEYLRPYLKEISESPVLTCYFFDGLLKELESRRFFKEDK